METRAAENGRLVELVSENITLAPLEVKDTSRERDQVAAETDLDDLPRL